MDNKPENIENNAEVSSQPATPETAKAPKKKVNIVKILIILLVIAGIVFALYQSGLISFLTDIDALQSWFAELGFIGYIAYILLYIVVAVFMIPGSAFTIVAGITFGPVLGGILSLIGATIGATVAFIIAKYIARGFIVSKFENNPIFKKIESGFEENGTSFLILTRLVPAFPYNVQNYAYGITSVSIAQFAIVSLITMAPGSFIYAFLAGEIATNGLSIQLLIQFAVAGVVLFLISLIPKYIAKKKGIKMD